MGDEEAGGEERDDVKHDADGEVLMDRPASKRLEPQFGVEDRPVEDLEERRRRSKDGDRFENGGAPAHFKYRELASTVRASILGGVTPRLRGSMTLVLPAVVEEKSGEYTPLSSARPTPLSVWMSSSSGRSSPKIPSTTTSSEASSPLLQPSFSMHLFPKDGITPRASASPLATFATSGLRNSPSRGTISERNPLPRPRPQPASNPFAGSLSSPSGSSLITSWRPDAREVGASRLQGSALSGASVTS